MFSLESLRKHLLAQVQGGLEGGLVREYGKTIGPACLAVASNVLLFEHLGEPLLLPWLPDGAGWSSREWPRVLPAILAAEPVRDCAAAVHARADGPGSEAFEVLRSAAWEWCQEEARQILERETDDLGASPDASELNAHELAQSRLFQSIEESQSVLQRLRGGEASPGAYRGRTTGHGFQDALLAYHPEKGGYWKTFLRQRYAYKLKDARKALRDTLVWEPRVPPNSTHAPEPAEPAEPAGPEGGAEIEDTAGRLDALRSRLAVAAQSSPPLGEALVVFELTYTSWINPTSYSAATQVAVATVAERQAEEAELRRLQARWWPAGAGVAPWNELQEPGPAVDRLVDAWSSLLGRDAEGKPDPAIRQIIAGELRAAAGREPETEHPIDARQAARCCVARADRLARWPVLDRLRGDFAEAGRLLDEEKVRLGEARDEETRCRQILKQALEDACANGASERERRKARSDGRNLYHQREPGSGPDLAEAAELIRQLEVDDRRRQTGASPLPGFARRQIEVALFHKLRRVRPVEALEREIQALRRLQDQGWRVNLDGSLQSLPTTLATQRKMEQLRQVELASLRLAAIEEQVENLDGPDGNLRRYRELRKYREPEGRNSAGQDRSKRFWIRSQPEVLKLLPWLSQPTVTRRLQLLRGWLESQGPADRNGEDP